MERYRSGHNGADSKGSRAYHSRERKISRFLRFPRKCFIFLEFWMNAFQFRPCKSRAKFKNNQIRRDIEVVITGLTRNIVGSVTHYSLKLRCLSAFTPRATALLKTCISQFSRNLGIRLKPLQFYMETYRSGHNGADSKFSVA